MNQQLDYEESLINMGGFVLKEQRYKKVEDRPTSSKQAVGSRLKQITKTSGGRNPAAATSHSFSGKLTKVKHLNFILTVELRQVSALQIAADSTSFDVNSRRCVSALARQSSRQRLEPASNCAYRLEGTQQETHRRFVKVSVECQLCLEANARSKKAPRRRTSTTGRLQTRARRRGRARRTS